MTSTTADVITERIRHPETEHISLRDELAKTPETNHYALLYESRQEQLNAALSFIQVGLENNERCLYIAAENTVEAIKTELEALGTEVCQAIEDGQLCIRSADDTYQKNGFDPERMLRYLLDEVDTSVAEGYAGFRVTGEMSWLLDAGVPFDEVLKYEANYQAATTEHEVVALCQYNKLRFDASAIVDIIQTHPKLIYRGHVCQNPYYTPPEEFLAADETDLKATRMLETIHDLTAAREAIKSREQRLTVTNRVLRHNLRNDMNVIRGHGEMLQDYADEPEAQASAEQIVATADDLLQIAEKARHIEQTLSVEGMSSKKHALRRIIADAKTQFAGVDSEVTITSDFDQSVEIEALPQIDLAFEALFEAITAHSSGAPSLVVTVSESTAGTKVYHEITIRIEEGTLPELEVAALIEGNERPLAHSTGLNMWIANWVINRSGGELQFSCGSHTCTMMEILLPSATNR